MKASTVVVVGLGCLNTLVAASLRLPSHSAARILKLRGGVTLAALQKDMQTALLTEDFKWAAEIKAKISKMSSEPQIATAATPTTRVRPGNVAALEEEKRIAVLCEDFQRAKELKNQIDEATQAKTSSPPPDTRNYDDVKAEINAARSAADNARFSASTEEAQDATAAAAVETNTASEVESEMSAPPPPATRNYDDVKAEINAARSAADNARFTASTEEAQDTTAAAAVETNTASEVETKMSAPPPPSATRNYDDVKAEINAARSAADNARFTASTEEAQDATAAAAVETNTASEVETKMSAPPPPATRNYDDVKAEINAARSAADNARFTASTEETKDATAAAAVETNTAPSIENDEKDSAQASVAPSAAPASSPLNPLSDDLLNAPLAADTLSSAARLNSAQRATAPLPWVDRVAALEEAKRVAVEEEDYDKAEALKLDILAVLEGAYAKAKELRAEAADNSNWTASDHPPPETAPDSTAEVASAALPDANTGATKVAAEVAEAEKAAAQAEAALEAALAQKATAVSSARAAAEAAAERVAVLRREL